MQTHEEINISARTQPDIRDFEAERLWQKETKQDTNPKIPSRIKSAAVEEMESAIQQLLEKLGITREGSEGLLVGASLLLLNPLDAGTCTCVRWIVALVRRIKKHYSDEEEKRWQLQDELIRTWGDNAPDVSVFIWPEPKMNEMIWTLWQKSDG